MYKNLSIRIKIAIVVSLCVLFTAALLGTISYVLSRNTLQTAYSSQMTSIRELKRRKIEAYYKQLHSQVKTFADDKMVIDATKGMTEAFLNANVNDAHQESRSTDMSNYIETEFIKRIETGSVHEYLSNDPKTIYFTYKYNLEK